MSTIAYGSAVRVVPNSYAATPVVRTRLRLTRRGRAVIASLVSLPLVIALMSMALNGGGATATAGDAVVETVTVEAGESLWSVAAAIAPESSTADVVADLIAVNELTSAELLPGQVLIVPARYSD
ncbi:LysM peptidoglycan-binding domain-containing protein [Microcella sp.]|uniref:LysM peptidoglycan-binding domain-containing protein n=1 Tax=Microcella sp. TaxID=1913979 RepID=UPI00299F5F64|nr:LysM peptidoglycan-binding domain-containing protein [Microcella sp.]MDX2025938.1 LysM peptidoglycan-binding domain-containing protein [Microcella sp.]